MAQQPIRLLLVEDDLNLGQLLKEFLESEGFHVNLCRDGISGLRSFQTEPADLCILDVMLPRTDGFTLAKQIRSQSPEIPVLFLTAKSMKEDKLAGFQLGADDYMTKPFDEEELVWRIMAILKRTGHKGDEVSQNTFQIGKYSFDYANQQLAFGEEVRQMTTKENEVLRLLCLHKNRILKRDDALVAIYGEADYFYGRSFDVFITKLRKYLKQDTAIRIENVHGVGFRLVDSTEAHS